MAYTPPSAQSLYQMVAPVALYPDRLVAQVLAASTYPDQITDAQGWLARNPGQHGDALVRAVNDQLWDPSVKALTSFPNVLEQLASNLPWTTELGQAYFHDPSDVMNAIQVMRARASAAGTLRSSPQLRVVAASAPLQQSAPAPATEMPAVPLYAGPAVVVPPPTVIAIEPAEPDIVYVPRYDPQVVYGTPVAVYPGYRWAAPAPAVVSAQPAVVPSAWLAFGTGVAVGAVGAVAGWAVHSPPWGWNAWNVHWGPPRPRAWVEGVPLPPPAVRPAVVYQGTTYVSRSRTVIENIHNVTVNNNNQHYITVNNNVQPSGQGAAATPAVAAAALPAGAQAGFASPQHPMPSMAPAAHGPSASVPPRALPLATALSHVQRPAPPQEPVARMQPAVAQAPASGGAPGQPQRMAQEHGKGSMQPSEGPLSRPAPLSNPGFARQAQWAPRPAEAHPLPARDVAQQPQQHMQPQRNPAEGPPVAHRADAPHAAPALHAREARLEEGRTETFPHPRELQPPANHQQDQAAGLLRAQPQRIQPQQPMPQPPAQHAVHAPAQSPAAQAPHRPELPQARGPQPHVQEHPHFVAAPAAPVPRHETRPQETPRREAPPREGGHPHAQERG